ncbi:hypothetical protein [Streptomyces botrytidirepellens]|uniref:Secreted protein n=1 Tax=Streptomyces botrytidirepellens TaxID=2486417 RepID=A0A3M8W1K2_9ACTN|nr:hypothetical protein [Streptomyces botrytidirepellens]RNG23297.1 hypothetical protein EEJ42_18710 [Streptomyces botrytidirepellens]
MSNRFLIMAPIVGSAVHLCQWPSHAAAAEAGASTAVLGATAEGRALYTSLGRRTASPVTGILHRPDAAPVG